MCETRLPNFINSLNQDYLRLILTDEKISEWREWRLVVNDNIEGKLVDQMFNMTDMLENMFHDIVCNANIRLEQIAEKQL